MTLPGLVLRGMLAVATPGVSPASRVTLPADCDGGCRAAIADRTGVRPELGFEWIRATWPGWSRQETEVEGFERYAAIAEGVAAVVSFPPPSWTWSGAELRLLLVTVARHESAFWRSVQEGKLRGPAGEWGLWQCHPSLPGCDARLTGLDAGAVERAARFAAEAFARARRLAEQECAAAWLDATLVVYGTGAGCEGTLPSLDARRRTFERVEAARRPLPFAALYSLERYPATVSVGVGPDGRLAEVR